MLKPLVRWAFARDALWTLLILCIAVIANEALAGKDSDRGFRQHGPLTSIDVVQNATDFFFEGPVNENGIPARGTPFVTTGYIYPAGTLLAYGTSSGVKANGEPEFPELLIGTWICRGWHIQDGDAETGVVIVSTQTFDFDDKNAGQHMIVTDGIELADFNVSFARPVTGGSGRFRRLRGQMQQMHLNTNASGGLNMTFELPRRH